MGFEQLAALKAQLASRAAASTATTSAMTPPSQATVSAEPRAAVSAQHRAKTGQRAAAAATVLGAVIGRLQQRFPKAFPRQPAPKVALKIGILTDLVAHGAALSLTEPELRAALAAWCQGQRYWASLQAGAVRVDLAGEAVGQVTDAEAKWGRQQAAWRGRRAPSSARPVSTMG